MFFIDPDLLLNVYFIYQISMGHRLLSGYVSKLSILHTIRFLQLNIQVTFNKNLIKSQNSNKTVRFELKIIMALTKERKTYGRTIFMKSCCVWLTKNNITFSIKFWVND
jgi:hypothetical protein